MSEREYVIQCYEAFFSCYQDKNMAIYGIGKNTQIILEHFSNKNIVGLMDECRNGERIYGKEIISIEEAVNRGVELVLIVARASNVRIIYRRISEACLHYGIRVYDINGEEVSEETIVKRDYEDYEKITFENLKQKIDKAEVVSFDIFDTLIMRDVLYPRDIFLLVEKQMGHNFRNKRVRAEMDLYVAGKNPRLEEIYEAIDEKFSFGYELEVERNHLYRRESGGMALDYALGQGKEVYFVSDMYLESFVLEDILQEMGIPVQRNRILVSCEFGKSKNDGLFSELRNREKSRRILHIGDNFEADIEAARRYGIEDTFYIPSPLKMLEDSCADSLLAYADTLENRLVIGKFMAQVFSDGFLFSSSQGKIVITANRQIGSVFVAPFVYRFYGWMLQEAKKRKLTHILLAARDGRIFEQIYRFFEEKNVRQTRMDYFYISRAVAVLAGIRDDDDILHSYRLAFNGSVEEMLKVRFRIHEDELCIRGEENEWEYVLRHRNLILKSAEEMRKHFEKYISCVCGVDAEKIGFFDFISSGTCQKALMNIVDFHLIGLYVGNVNNEIEYKSDMDVVSMFGSYNVFQKGDFVLANYFLLENIITSEEATLVDFDESGYPILGKETRTSNQLRDLEEIQNAILGYVKESSLQPEEMLKVDLRLVDQIFGLLNRQSCVVQTDYFSEHQLEDAFCNRKFELVLS
ncbi:hypothetical protein C817_01347 [Dorea sp. 5-2]|nr:hypothetical protein C817_01347 [Dorea sp. 5-2]